LYARHDFASIDDNPHRIRLTPRLLKANIDAVKANNTLIIYTLEASESIFTASPLVICIAWTTLSLSGRDTKISVPLRAGQTAPHHFTQAAQTGATPVSFCGNIGFVVAGGCHST